MRILGLDYGEKTIGVAISDPEGRFALGLETLRRPREENLKESVHRIGDIIKEYDIGEIVIGYPRHMDGTVSERCEKTTAFMKRLERTFRRVRFVLQDERLTSVQAEKAMALAGADRRSIKSAVDMNSAVIILGTYLDRKIHGGIDPHKNNERTV